MSKKPIPANAYNLFIQGKITFEEMTGEAPKKQSKPKGDPAERKKAKREEDNIQSAAIAYLHEHYPDIPVYGNATANIFNSGGLYRKALPGSAYPILRGMGIEAKSWGSLIDIALKGLGLNMSVAKLEKDQEGAKFWQMKRTKTLGAVSSWPDIQVCFCNYLSFQVDGATMSKNHFGLFMELKKPDASVLPFGVNDSGRFSTNDHLQDQAKMLSRLCAQGYLGLFCVGYDQVEAAIKLYMGNECEGWYFEQQSLSFKDGTKGMIYRLRKS
jgi:hypothetical protein